MIKYICDDEQQNYVSEVEFEGIEEAIEEMVIMNNCLVNTLVKKYLSNCDDEVQMVDEIRKIMCEMILQSDSGIEDFPG